MGISTIQCHSESRGQQTGSLSLKLTLQRTLEEDGPAYRSVGGFGTDWSWQAHDAVLEIMSNYGLNVSPNIYMFKS